MNIQTDVIRTEPHVEIGDLIERHAEALLQEWCRRALEEESAAKRVHFDILRDHLAKFLRAVGGSLKQSGGDAREHYRSAVEHGEQRWESGWSLTEVVRDYQLVQLVILQFLEKTLPRPLHYREMMAIGVFIDDAIAASIRSYVAQRDVEVVRAEKERSQSLEEVNRRKDEFLAMLGHELRNPLAPIQNSVQILRAVLKSPVEPVLTAVDVIDRQTKHLVRLVDDILDLAKIGQGRFELRKSRVNLVQLLRDSAETVQPLMKARQHALTVSFPAENLEIDADPHRMLQVIGNILGNAAKYTSPGGCISLGATRENGDAVIRVRDNGMGIPPDMISRVFDVFLQVEDAKPHAQGGLGLGLTLVERLVQQHGGTVACHSAGKGEGSEFVVRLPAVGETLPADGPVGPQTDTSPSMWIVKTEPGKPPSR